MEELKQRIKELIYKNGLTVKEFAEKIHQKPSTVYSWITPGRTTPKPQNLETIARELHTTCEYLITGDPYFIRNYETMHEIIEYQKKMIQELSNTVELLSKDLEKTKPRSLE